MATILRSDPLRNFKFQVQINHTTSDIQTGGTVNLVNLGFMSVSGLSMSTEMIPYREGGMNTTTKKMPGQSDFPQVTFQRGLFVGQGHLFNWFKDIFYLDRVYGNMNDDFRTTVLIRVLPHPSTRHPENLVNTGGGQDPVQHKIGHGKQVFALLNAWPTSMSWSDLDAGGNGIIMEQMVLAHEGLIPVHAQTMDPASNANWMTYFA